MGRDGLYELVLEGRCPNFTKGSVIWLRRRGRIMTSWEKLMLQGYPIRDEKIQHELLEMTEQERSSIAGDMWNGFALAAQVLAMIIHVGELPH